MAARINHPRAKKADTSLAPIGPALSDALAQLRDLDPSALAVQWRNHIGGEPPGNLPKFLVGRILGFRLQAEAFGDLPASAARFLDRLNGPDRQASGEPIAPVNSNAALRPGTLLTREWRGALHQVMALEGGFAWNGATYQSLSEIARAITGTRWSGPKFFGVSPIGSGGASAGSVASKRDLAKPRIRRSRPATNDPAASAGSLQPARDDIGGATP
jgi:hypothetical protein